MLARPNSNSLCVVIREAGRSACARRSLSSFGLQYLKAVLDRYKSRPNFCLHQPGRRGFFVQIGVLPTQQLHLFITIHCTSLNATPLFNRKARPSFRGKSLEKDGCLPLRPGTTHAPGEKNRQKRAIRSSIMPSLDDSSHSQTNQLAPPRVHARNGLLTMRSPNNVSRRSAPLSDICYAYNERPAA
jgi:hypothetical protein